MLGWFKKKLGQLTGNGVEPEEDKVEAGQEEIEVVEIPSEVEVIPVAELEEPVAEVEEEKVEADLEELEVFEILSEVEAIPVAELAEPVAEVAVEEVELELEEIEIVEIPSEVETTPVAELAEPVAEVVEEKVEAGLEESEVAEIPSEVETAPLAELAESVAEVVEEKVEVDREEVDVGETPSKVEAAPLAESAETVAEAVEEKVEAVAVFDPEEIEKPKSIPHQDVGFFSRLKKRLSKSRGSLVKRVDELFLGKKVIDQELLDDLEEILITADLGIATTQELVDHASDKVARKELSDPSALKQVLREKITEYLLSSDQPAELVMPESGPFIIMVVGVNGVGKTTTIGKMARKFVRSGQSVALVAADTFRAAAIEQLQIWGERIGVEVISQKFGSDPSSVVFDALAGAQNFDVVIIDTAGRLHTKVNLMEELKKIKRVAGKKLEGAPHEVLLVLDATTGQNGISQARLFNEAVGVTGLALTKLDGTAKGGIVVNVCREFNIPIRFIGIGEQMDDLRDFDPNEFAEALFAEDNGEDGELNFE